MSNMHVLSKDQRPRLRGFGPELAAELDEIVDLFNSRHDDAIRLIAHFVGECPSAEAAQIAALEPESITLLVGTAAPEPERVALELDEPVDSLEKLQAQLMGLLLRSRQQAGEDVGLTRIEREVATTRTLPTLITEVARTRVLSPNLREITLAGGLDAFRPIGAEQFVYVMVSRPGAGEMIREGATMAELRAAPEADRPYAAYYTVRRFRQEEGELDLWFVVHGHAGGVGGWAARAERGEPVALWGPRCSFHVPDDAEALLLVGDETALPAIAAILEESSLPARVLIETIDRAHVVELPRPEKAEVEWVFRGSTPPQESTALLEAIRKQQTSWSEGQVAFGAGESSRMLEVRRYLRGLGAPPKRVHLTAYWRSGRALNG